MGLSRRLSRAEPLAFSLAVGCNTSARSPSAATHRLAIGPQSARNRRQSERVAAWRLGVGNWVARTLGCHTMAGKPLHRAMLVELDALTRRYFEIEDGAAHEHSHLDFVVGWLENGGTMRSLADNLSVAIGHEVWAGKLTNYLHKNFSESETALVRARARGAYAIVDDALAIVDAPALDTVDVARAASRARVRHWTAERWNKPAFAGQQTAAVTISIGSLHLDALQAARQPAGNHAASLPATPASHAAAAALGGASSGDTHTTVSGAVATAIADAEYVVLDNPI